MNHPPTNPLNRLSWIAADWGTSNLRVWGFDGRGRVLNEASSALGMSKLKPDEFESALLSVVGGWLIDDLTVDVFACGMVGAKQGWIEVPYGAVPCKPTTATIQVATKDPRLRVHILAGLCQAAPSDVMRGEETQIAGLLSENTGLTGIVCLPGTHSKWVQIKNGNINAFQTFMTGELFAAFKESTILRHSMPADELSIDVFEAAVKMGLKQPEHAASQFFQIRANGLLNETSKSEGSSMLSGTLIAMEIASVVSRWSPAEVTLVGEPSLIRRYQRALRLANIKFRTVDGNTAVLNGLRAAEAAAKVTS